MNVQRPCTPPAGDHCQMSPFVCHRIPFEHATPSPTKGIQIRRCTRNFAYDSPLAHTQNGRPPLFQIPSNTCLFSAPPPNDDFTVPHHACDGDFMNMTRQPTMPPPCLALSSQEQLSNGTFAFRNDDASAMEGQGQQAGGDACMFTPRPGQGSLFDSQMLNAVCDSATRPHNPCTFFGTGPSALCTPQTSRAEIELRQALDLELNSVNIQWRQAVPPLVTPITDSIFLGGFPVPETVEELERLGVTHVINCCAGHRPTSAECSEKFSVGSIEAKDEPDYYILSYHYEEFAELMDSVRDANGKVFIHCLGGVNRSVALVFAYLLERFRFCPLDVVRLFRQNGRPVILENTGFRWQLIEHYLQSCAPDI